MAWARPGRGLGAVWGRLNGGGRADQCSQNRSYACQGALGPTLPTPTPATPTLPTLAPPHSPLPFPLPHPQNATFAAVEEGIVPGGGAALLHLSELVPAFRDTLPEGEERLGADIVMKALRAPCRTIAENAGVEGEVVVQQLLGQPFSVGYNAMAVRGGG